MKVVLFTVCGSYTHTSLALRCLRPYLEEKSFEVSIVEGNLRDRAESLLHSLYAENAEIYSFSCYIWNIEEMLEIAENLRVLLPKIKIIFGGPEVSYDTERFEKYDFIDTIICGEGEHSLTSVCVAIRAGEDTGKIYPAEKSFITSGILYRKGEIEGQNKSILYYESSRGCPFSCSYCLSSAECGVVSKSAMQTVSDLDAFEELDNEFKILKFVDRTFNFNIDRANEIWRALLSDKYTKKYHFEVCASLLNEESFEIFAQMPEGKIQLEVGLQSTNPETLREISRHLDPSETLKNCKRIKDMGNIHLHLDLIAGLPYEDFESFKSSFDDAYYACHQLQLGFLKLLHGTALRNNADKYGYKYLSHPPYTVLSSNWISYEELHHLKKISYLLERYHESGNFNSCLEFALSKMVSPFDFYSGFVKFIEKMDGREIQKISQADAFSLLYSYVCRFLSAENCEIFSELMHEDFARKEVRKMPRLNKN